MGERKDNASLDAEFDALSYSYANTPSSLHIAVHGERSLWCAVIQQAFMDMCPQYFSGKGGNAPVVSRRPRDKAQHEAMQWLIHDGYDFQYICSLAGVTPSIMRRAAKEFMVMNDAMEAVRASGTGAQQ